MVIVLHLALLPMAVVAAQRVGQTNVQPIQRGRQEVFHMMAIVLVQMPLPQVVMEVVDGVSYAAAGGGGGAGGDGGDASGAGTGSLGSGSVGGSGGAGVGMSSDAATVVVVAVVLTQMGTLPIGTAICGGGLGASINRTAGASGKNGRGGGGEVVNPIAHHIHWGLGAGDNQLFRHWFSDIIIEHAFGQFGGR